MVLSLLYQASLINTRWARRPEGVDPEEAQAACRQHLAPKPCEEGEPRA
jgi:hypothetical protein